MSLEYWGKELLVDIRNCTPGTVQSAAVIKEFVDELVVAIDMVPYGETWIQHFAEHDPAKAGYSMMQMIETSNICGHFCDSTDSFYLNVFSCKDFDPNDVERVIKSYFGSTAICNSRVVLRDAFK